MTNKKLIFYFSTSIIIYHWKYRSNNSLIFFFYKLTVSLTINPISPLFARLQNECLPQQYSRSQYLLLITVAVAAITVAFIPFPEKLAPSAALLAKGYVLHGLIVLTIVSFEVSSETVYPVPKVFLSCFA